MPAEHGEQGGIPRSSRASSIAALLVLAALWAFFLRGAFTPDRSFALLMDNEFFIGAVLSSISASIAHGDWPLRMDTVLGGVPLYNFPQLSPLYPLYFASLPIFRTPTEVVHSMHWITLGHLLILQINTYVFLRVIGASRIAAVAGAGLFAFSANSLTYAAWLNITAPYAWFPLYLAGLVGIFRFPGRPSFVAMALVSIVLLALASPAQPLIHAILLSVIFVIAHWASIGLAEGWQRTKHPLALLIAVGVLACMLVSPVLMPAALEFKGMIRWIGPFPPVVGNAPIPFTAFQIDQLSIRDLAGVLFRQEGAAVGSPYVGVIALALAGVAAVSCFGSWITKALVFIAIYSIISSTGSNLGLAHVNYLVPILNKIREPSRFLVLFQFAIAALAALGIDQLRRRASADAETSTPARRLGQLASLWIVAALGTALLLLTDGRVISPVPPWASILFLLLLIAITLWSSRKPSRLSNLLIGALWASGALLLLAADVRWTPAPLYTSTYNTGGGRQLDKVFDRLAQLDPQRQYRVIFDGSIDKQMASMLASYKGIRTLNAYFNPAPYRQFEELYYHGPRSINYFQALGARYLICDSCKEDAIRGYSFLESVDALSIYEAKQALPHSQMLTAVDGTYASLGDFAAKLTNADLSQGLLYVRAEDIDVAGPPPQTRCEARETRRSDSRMSMVTRCPTKGVLIVNEFFDEAWKAAIDGDRARILRVNGSQMAVALPPGQHEIEFRYRPKSFLFSIPIAILALVTCAVLIALRRRARRSIQSIA
ncbi:hypothetical protein C7T35_18185 [Variovorax sp. WS11]|nr:hypothetical protein [Variovorax sp. WS11]NDZ14507.1 YfhO family protein [Variovorax sp. WS11]PSL83127.1 hypothetical protein C7T35_18185 [Variovorax sp. WS11]